MKNSNCVAFSNVLLAGVMAMVAVAWSAAAYGQTGVMSEGDINRGARTWSNNCARCHEMRSPTEFRDDLWKPILTHMRVRAGLTGQQQRDILAFLQATNHPRAVKVAISNSGPGTGLSGKDIYGQICVACHAVNGTGAIPGTPDFTSPGGALLKSDDELIQNITAGFQSPGSPMAMPAKGGNPDLNDVDVRAVLTYLRDSFGK